VSYERRCSSSTVSVLLVTVSVICRLLPLVVTLSATHPFFVSSSMLRAATPCVRGFENSDILNSLKLSFGMTHCRVV